MAKAGRTGTTWGDEACGTAGVIADGVAVAFVGATTTGTGMGIVGTAIADVGAARGGAGFATGIGGGTWTGTTGAGFGAGIPAQPASSMQPIRTVYRNETMVIPLLVLPAVRAPPAGVCANRRHGVTAW